MKKLSTINGTIGKVIVDNYAVIKTLNTKESLYGYMDKILVGVSEKDRAVFLETLAKKRTAMDAQLYIFNYMAAGDGLRAI